MKSITVTLNGATALMMHNDQLANPMNEYTRRLKEITSKRTKTDEDHEAIRRIEFEGGLYYDRNIGVYIPGRNLFRCLIDAATLTKAGTKVKRGVVIQEEYVPLAYEGPRTPAELYRADIYVDTRTAGNKGSRIVRTRPVFPPPWSVTFTLFYVPEVLNPQELKSAWESAGMMIGLGDYRPGKSGGSYGRFELAGWKV